MKKLPTLTKQRLARRIGQTTGLPNQVTADVVDALIDAIADQLASGGRIEIANFLILDVQARTRLAKVDNNGENERLFAPHTETFFVLKCRPGKRLRARLRHLAHRS